jgi:hypothetical protein
VAVACPWAGEAWNLQQIDLNEVGRAFQDVHTRDDRLRPSDLKGGEATQHLLQARSDQMMSGHHHH